ncbi:hypothetical protein Kisp01_42000 [Kineosporia sp. NBRC 101677]|uniref:YciI family protein n=1 Tax=Kineosporia sp. NBRC 101677 TaxID=3032197 RepID=UPI0024A4FB4F|nr:YciI family protein [Kineosporia sp. NBRC 101677]GLY17185.1 hypothetical protein Kisp01_42000 [Kineosporia sp. NBRC 101677]
MPRYMISFDEGTMIFTPEELPELARASMAVVRAAQAAGVWVFGGGLIHQGRQVVATDGSVTDYVGDAVEEKALGGFSIVDVPTRQEALEWAARIAVSCRCPQKVHELMPDPQV